MQRVALRAIWMAMLALWLALPAAAQQVWLQIEAQPTRAEAEARARAYSGAFPDVSGFRMASGWYSISLGPYPLAEAERRLADLVAENLIPRDSFISRGEVYTDRYWAPGQEGIASAETPALPVTIPDVSAAPLDATPLPALVPEPVPDETPAQARRSEAALTQAEREALQSALAFFGHYSAAIDGAIGPGTRAAMASWQTASGLEPTGVLTSLQRQRLLDDRAEAEAMLGLQPFTEPEAGIALSLPAALVEFDRYEAPFVQFKPRNDSGITLTLISLAGDEVTLFGLYDTLAALDRIPPDGPRQRSDTGFTIEGRDAGGGAFATATLTGGLIKGFLLTWEPRADDLAGRTVSAIRASFRPVGRRALDPSIVPLDDAARSGMLAGMDLRRPALSRSGFYVTAQGTVATTTEAVQDCTRITLDRDTEARLLRADPATGLALLEPATPLAPPAVAVLDPGTPRPGTEIAVAGYSYGDDLPAPALTFGTLDAATGLDGEADLRRLTIPVLPGDAGGVVLDPAGTAVGMLLPRPEGGERVLPDRVAFALSSAVIAAELSRQGLIFPVMDREGALAPSDLADRGARMTVLVSCWR